MLRYSQDNLVVFAEESCRMREERHAGNDLKVVYGYIHHSQVDKVSVYVPFGFTGAL